MNNDGIDDVVVGAYLWDKPLPPSRKKLKSIGRVYVYSGRWQRTVQCRTAGG
ncbi:MAG: integrin alpha [Pseudomonadales bacterium]